MTQDIEILEAETAIIDESLDEPEVIDSNTQDNYRIFKKNSQHNYDYIQTTSLIWPSSTVQWVGDRDTEIKHLDSYRLVTATFTSNSFINKVNYFTIPIINRNQLNIKNYDAMKEEIIESATSRAKMVQSINHLHDDINRIRIEPNKIDLIATINNKGIIHVFDRTKHPNNPLTDDFKPEIVLRGHSAEGYALSWNYQNIGQLTSGASDEYINMYDIRSNYTKSAGVLEPSKAIHLAGSGAINDLNYVKNHDSIFGSVQENGSLNLYDLRLDTNDMISSKKSHAHETGVNAIAFNSLNSFCIATGDSSGVIKIWDSRNLDHEIDSIKAHDDSVTCLQWNLEMGNVLGSSSQDKFVKMWDWSKSNDEDKLLFTHGGHMLGVNEINWNPHDKWLMASVADDNSLHVWKPASTIVGK